MDNSKYEQEIIGKVISSLKYFILFFVGSWVFGFLLFLIIGENSEPIEKIVAGMSVVFSYFIFKSIYYDYLYSIKKVEVKDKYIKEKNN